MKKHFKNQTPFLKPALEKNRMLDFEFIKHVRKPYLLIMLIICTAVNLIAIRMVTHYYQTATYDHKNYQKIYHERLKGPLTEEKVSYVLEEGNRLKRLTEAGTVSTEVDSNSITGINLYADQFLFTYDILPDIKYAHTYYFDSQLTVSKAEKNVQAYKETGNRYDQAKNEQIVQLFSGRFIPDFYNMRGMRYFIAYNFSWIFMLLFGVLIIVPVYVSEQESKMSQLLPTMVKGKRQLAWVKVRFTLLSALGVTAWFSLMDLIGFSVFTPLEGFNAPLYALKEFGYTGFNITVGQYLLLAFGCRLIAICVFYLLILLFSKLLKQSISAFALSVGAAAFIYLSRFFAKSAYNLTELISPSFLLNSRFPMMQYSVQNIFGNPVPSIYVGLAINLLMLVFLLWLNMWQGKSSENRKAKSK